MAISIEKGQKGKEGRRGCRYLTILLLQEKGVDRGSQRLLEGYSKKATDIFSFTTALLLLSFFLLSDVCLKKDGV